MALGTCNFLPGHASLSAVPAIIIIDMVYNIGQGGRVQFSQGIENVWGTNYRHSIGRLDALFEKNEGLEIEIGCYTVLAEDGQINIYENGQLADKNIQQVLVETFGQDQAPYHLYHVLGQLKKIDLSEKNIKLDRLVDKVKNAEMTPYEAALSALTEEPKPAPPPLVSGDPLGNYYSLINFDPTRYLDPIGVALSDGTIDEAEAAGLKVIPQEIVDILKDGKITQEEAAALGISAGIYENYIAGQEPIDQLNGLQTAYLIQQALPDHIAHLSAADVALIKSKSEELLFIGEYPVTAGVLQQCLAADDTLLTQFTHRVAELSKPPTLAQN